MKKTGDLSGMGVALIGLACIAAVQGNSRAAVRYYRQAIEAALDVEL